MVKTLISTAQTDKTGYRTDLRGLRAIAALLVGVHHVWGLGISGGVDVFIVLAGYFVAGRYLRNEHDGIPTTFSANVTNYLRHTGPQVYLVLGAVVLLSFFLADPARWRMILHDVVFSALFFENYWLIWKQHDYLDVGAPPLMQHLWAMAILLQAYVVWLLLAVSADRLSTVRNAGRLRAIRTVLLITGSTSFLWSIEWTAVNSTAAYFCLSTRWWEFAVGALVGLWQTDSSKIAPRFEAFLTWLGLGLIVTTGMMVGARPFPGAVAAWPVLGALLIVVFGRPSKRFNAGYYLSSAVLGTLSLYSLGFYLWHWPLYVFAYGLVAQRPGLAGGTALLMVSLLIAVVTTYIFSDKERRLRRPMLAGALCFLAMVVAIDRSLKWFGPSLGSSPLLFGEMAHVRPGPFLQETDTVNVFKECSSKNVDVKKCSFGHSTGTGTVYLVGGSHSAHWLPALIPIAEKYGFRIVTVLKFRCVFGAASDQSLYGAQPNGDECRLWNENAMAMILADRPSLVIGLATRPIFEEPSRTRGVRGEHVPDGYVAVYRELTKKNIPVLAIRDTPWLLQHAGLCTMRTRYLSWMPCSTPRGKVLDDRKVIEQLSKMPPGVAYLDMTDAFCDGHACLPIRDGVRVFADNNHLTTAYAQKLGPNLSERLMPFLIQLKLAKR